jgi:vacuolar protein sorting-associated protein 3
MKDVGLDYPYIATLLPNGTIEIHSVETQSIVQVIPPPSSTISPENLTGRLRLASCLNGYFVPSSQKTDKMRMTSVPLMRGTEIHS